MVTALLLVIYLSYVGLGLSHSLFGVALPSIQTEFGVSAASANYITMIITGSTIVSSMLGARLVNKFGTRAVLTVSASVAALAVLGFSVSGNLWMMCLFAIPLGLSAGATDAALNNYIALHYSAMHLNFMHCFYGVGIMASPYIMSIILENSGWRVGYQAILGIQILIIAVIVCTLPLWKKVKHNDKNDDGESVIPENLSYFAMAKTSEIRLNWLMCIAVNAIEGVSGTWGAFYLVHAHGFREADAAALITMFYIGLALGRFLSGILSTKISGWSVIKISVAVMVLGTLVLFVPVSIVAAIGFFFVGLGNGPIYPNFIHLAPRHFGKKHSASVLSSQMATAWFGVLIGPPIYGCLVELIAPSVMPVYILGWDVLFIIVMFLFVRTMKKKDKKLS